ncbi:unannotated protein [freshwater metagenome]|uniref:Unannotated protein n=1 Tax=freshwater metagenome TaxID=449393 RepID=A0A6J7NPS3_9ZZZZ
MPMLKMSAPTMIAATPAMMSERRRERWRGGVGARGVDGRGSLASKAYGG